MDETTERIRGDEKDEIIAQARDTPQFQEFRSFFKSEYGYDISDAGVIAVEKDEGTYHLVTFSLVDSEDLRAEINITLFDGEPVSAEGTIESLEDNLIDEVEVFEFADGNVQHVGTA